MAPLKWIVIAMAVGFLAWILVAIPSLRSPAAYIDLATQSFEGVSGPFAERAAEVFDAANAKRKSLNRCGNVYHVVSVISAWLGFLLATAITAIAAFFSPSADPEQAKSAEALKTLQRRLKRHSWLIGLLAAGGAICAPLSERTAAAADRCFGCATELVHQVQQTRVRLADQNLSHPEAEGLLDELENEVSQACTGAK